ncbi:hypothetical protein Bca4012_013928 [Brassica carinata]
MISRMVNEDRNVTDLFTEDVLDHEAVTRDSSDNIRCAWDGSCVALPSPSFDRSTIVTSGNKNIDSKLNLSHVQTTAPFRCSPSLLLASRPANLRMVRAVTSATAASSEPSSTTKTREPSGIMKPRPVTPEMQDVVGESVIPRTQALKRIWAYIKEHDLQIISQASCPDVRFWGLEIFLKKF